MDALDKKPLLLVVCGPTATGKTALSVKLATMLNGEVISADSMQIYKNLNIGTAKVTPIETNGMPHHLIDIIEPDISFSVANYVIKAKQAVEDIYSRNHIPIMCGGTGLYISSFIKGISFTNEKADSNIKKKLRLELQEFGAEVMYKKLKGIDSVYANTLHPNNTVRILRALEIFEQTGIKMSDNIKASTPKEKPYSEMVFYLNYRDRNLLYDNINKRVELMLENGILKEAKYVFDNKYIFTTAANAIGYKEFFPYFTGESTLGSCIENLKQATRRYAKRQITWFQSIENTNIIYVDESDTFNACLNILKSMKLL